MRFPLIMNPMSWDDTPFGQKAGGPAGRQIKGQAAEGGSMASDAKAAILQAARSGDLDALRQLTAAEGADVVRMDDDPDELTTLHVAAGAGQLAVVEYLLSPAVKADPRAAGTNNFSPLHSAAMNGHAAVCEALLRAGAEVDIQTDTQQTTPLHNAAFGGHLETIQVLLTHGADRTLVNSRSERPVETARRQGCAEAVALLGADEA